MRRRTVWLTEVALYGTMVFAAPARAADEPPRLELQPCTIELVDGTEIKGKLAVQFDMDAHLVVYSPRLATVRSLLKKHVHAVTVNGEREQLNPKDALSEEDQNLLGQVDWPDAPPAHGPKPPYSTETWEKPRQLMVWASPGRSGRFEEPQNWLANGERMTQWPRPQGVHYGLIFFEKDQADFLFPASSKAYTVRPRGTNARVRHVTIEAGAKAEIKLNNGTGNIWVSPDGEFDGGGGAMLGGQKHTFFLNGRPTATEAPTTPETFRALMNSASSFGRKWIVRKDSPDASITLVGSFGSGDETHWMRGVTVLSENSVIAIGPRCVQTVGRDATLIMKSGSVLGKRSGNQCYKNDMRIKGALLAGTPDEPLTRDCYLGISIKDSEGRLDPERAKRYGARGLTVVPGARIRVYTQDPAKARLCITWHGILGKRGGDDGTPQDYYQKLPESDRTINVNILGEQVLRDVVFDWVGKGDIRLLDPQIRRKWQRVRLGDHNKAEGAALFATLQPDEEMQKQIARWREAREVPKWARDDYGQGARHPRIVPSGGTFAVGDTVEVRLEAMGDPEIRYTLDGSDAERGKTYTGPLTLAETTTVRAGCFHSPPPHFRRQWGEVTDTFTFVQGAHKPERPPDTKPGLNLRIYEGQNSFEKMHRASGEPMVEQRVERFLLNVPEGRMKSKDGYVYTGYLEIDTPGLYRLYTETEAPSRLYIGERLVVDNHRRYRYDWKPSSKVPLESWGSLRLEPGRHAIRLEYARGAGFSGWPPWVPQENEPFRVCYEGPGIHKQPIPAAVLSHQPRAQERSRP